MQSYAINHIQSYVTNCHWLQLLLLARLLLVLIFVPTFLENSAPTNRFRLQTEQSKFPAHLSVTTGVDMMEF